MPGRWPGGGRATARVSAEPLVPYGRAGVLFPNAQGAKSQPALWFKFDSRAGPRTSPTVWWPHWAGHMSSYPAARPWECVLWEVQSALSLADGALCASRWQRLPPGISSGGACGGWAVLWGLPTVAESGKGCGVQLDPRKSRAEADGHGGLGVPPASPVQPAIGWWEKGLLFTETKRRLKSF